jgi:serine/threonine protein kinase
MSPERWRQIEELYHSARERGASVLQNADPALRTEVEKLLEQDAESNILNRPVSLGMAASTFTMASPESRFGPYQLEELLGEGGMGQVFRATDSRLGRKVAIKVTQNNFTDRFDREARAIAVLNHPHICTLYDVGPNYLVMELVEGETLAARLKRGKLSLEQTIQYGGQIADALAAAHAKGVIHRDLKPGNLMVTKNGVKVLDFGLARSVQDETITQSDVVIGTPAYMAPEQRQGGACDARTDIYALGLVLFEMASGKRAVAGTPLSFDSLPHKLAHVVERCLSWEARRPLANSAGPQART